MAHYYDAAPSGELNINEIKHYIGDEAIAFYSANGVFSKDRIDFGSHFLVETVSEHCGEVRHMLDIGCGYGAIGISLALLHTQLSVDMVDVNQRAIQLTEKNIKRHQLAKRGAVYHVDAFDEKAGYYDLVVTNPPIRAGKTVVFEIYQSAHRQLKAGAALYVVIQKKQGAPSSQKYLNQLFGNCTVAAKRAGYYILRSIK